MRWAAPLLLVVVLAVLPLVLTEFANETLARIGVFAVAVLGLNVVMGYTGQVSLGQIFFLGLGAYVTAYGVTNDWNIVLVFVLACLIPAVAGLLVALAAARLGGLAIAMVTIALPIVGVPLAKRLSEFTGGSQGVSARFTDAPEGSGLYDDQWQLYLVLVIGGIVFLLTRFLVRGKYGRAFAIVKGNENVASSMGISPYRYKVLAFTIASLIGGVSGFLYMVVVQYTSPETMSFGHSIELLVAMVIGGAGSIVGLAARRRVLRGRPAADERRRPEPHGAAAGRAPAGRAVRPPRRPRVAAPRGDARAAALSPPVAATPRHRPRRRRPQGRAPRRRNPIQRGKVAHEHALSIAEGARHRRRVGARGDGQRAAAGGTPAAAAMRPRVRPAPASPTPRSRSASPRRSADATAGPGTCTVAGVTAYFGAKNAAGGVEFGDGKTRTVEIQALDDTYDPQQAAANYDQLKGERLRDDRGAGHADQPRLARGGDRRRGAAGADHDRRPAVQRHPAEPMAARVRADLPERGRGLR